MTHSQESLGDRLAARRRGRIVGRTGEVELFRAALAAPDESFRVLFVYGPGGVGKTTLLTALADAAADMGAQPVLIEARMTLPDPQALRDALASAVGTEDWLGELASQDRPVLLIDAFEAVAMLEEWLRAELLPALPGTALVVIAGRTPPSARWIADPAWRDLLRIVSLRNLPPDDARAYLRAEGVPASQHDRLLRLSHGHPLTLTLLAEVLRGGGGVPDTLADAPDLVGRLLASVVEAAPTARHRTALEAAAHVRYTTESLLRAVLGGNDAAELFDWLRGLSFVQSGRDGLFPHDLARDVLEADLRWRDPAGYAVQHRLIRDHLIELVQAAGSEPERHRRIADVMFAARGHPVVARALEGLGTDAHLDRVRDGDRGALLAMTGQQQGREQAALLGHWLRCQPQAFRVFRGADGSPLGCAGYLGLHEADAADLAVDPGARAMWAYAQRHGAPRPGEQVMAWRFHIARTEHYEATLTLITVWHAHEIIARPRVAWAFLGTFTDVELWQPAMDYMDFARAPEADYQVDRVRYAVWAHDWRRTGVAAWLQLQADRDVGVEPRTPAPPTALVLSQPEFADAVRDALRDLHDPSALAASPLARSRVVGEAGGSRHPATALRELLTEAARTMRADPHSTGDYELIERTFLRPARTQERTAAELHLSFSTYRRHRDRAVARITHWLWQRELYGADRNGQHMDTE